MNVEQGAMYVDGKPVEVQYMMKNGDMMVPACFFKHAGVEVYPDLKGTQVVLKTQEKRERIDSIASGNFISLRHAAEKLGIKVCYDPAIFRTYLITSNSPWQKPKVLYRGDTSGKKVALTFDDGPDDHTTPIILDILESKGVKATFFVIGKQAKFWPKALERMVKEGHQIGNHSWSHEDLAKLPTDEVIKEIKKAERMIQSVTGMKPDIIRPPFGSFADADLNAFNRLGLKTVMWNIDTVDYAGASTDEIINTVTRDLSPGSIILQHSFQNSTGILDGTIEALPIIIDQLRSQGMEFVTIEKLLSIN